MKINFLATAFLFILFSVVGLNYSQAQKNSALATSCRKQLNGTNGCYNTDTGSCLIGFNYCVSSGQCSVNGGVWKVDRCYAKTSDDYGNEGKNASANSCSDPNAMFDSQSRSCKCKDGFTLYQNTCLSNSDFKAVSQNTNATNPKTVTNPTIESCVAEVAQAVENCQTMGNQAVKDCDQQAADSNKTQQNMQSAVSMADALLRSKAAQNISSGAGSYDQGSCLGAGMLASTAYYGLDMLKKNCDAEVNKCKSQCNVGGVPVSQYIQSNFNSLYNRCLSLLSATNKVELKNDLHARLTELAQNANEAVATCNSSLTKQENLAQYMGQLNNAGNASRMCSCQTSSGNNCSNLPTLAQCAANPGLAGCPTNCNVNPNSADCACVLKGNCVPGGNPTVASFVAPSGGSGSSTGGVSVGDASGAGSGLNGSSLDLGDLSSNGSGGGGGISGNPDSPFASAGGGGGGGAGSASGSGDEGHSGADAGSENEKTGLGGLLQTAKGVLGSLFGGSSNKTDSAKGFGSANGATGVAVNGVRGISSNSTLAGSNANIFKVMSNQYFNDKVVDPNLK